MKYLSVCSGIEAASVAWHTLGWEPAAFCEIEAFPSAVLEHRYPNVPNYGDFTRLTDAAHPIHGAGVDLLVGGTPCQAFSVAGLRQGLADPRGGLSLEYVRLARALGPRWLLWENVPGVLSSGQARDFGSFIGALVESGYGLAWRVLDAQHVRVDGYAGAVPQRRKRVFLVGCLGGDASRAASVLLEPEGVRGHTPPRRASRKGAAADAVGGVEARFWNWNPVAESLTCTSDDQRMPDKNRMQMVVCPSDVPVCLNAGAMGRREPGSETMIPVITYGNKSGQLDTDGSSIGVLHPVVGFQTRGSNIDIGQISGTIGTNADRASDSAPMVAQTMSVRRLTPIECERLQGFPDGWTAIPWKGKSAGECPAGPRYKALGNSMACNVMRWLGTRIAMVDALEG